LSELKEIRGDAYESARLSKERSKLVHDRMILNKDFSPDMKMLLYDLRLHIFPGKLRSHCTSPFVVIHVFPYGAVEIQDPASELRKRWSNIEAIPIDSYGGGCRVSSAPRTTQ